ncbi:TlpA family protein disulfide reductase [Filimonas effusa]|uniref:TlpA family protein disulfide reductase n=1 Tax=Filimonas effusa TaxID=2508721 RepID=A0A4Q1D234_9BACT|nr:TlpA disulfide reductase family protein [Filimonas effusa]RXK81938.1 TlpA family protein disulfide reductase [Filimonas effusa]
MRHIFSVFVLAGLATNLSAQSRLIIKGTIKGDTKGFNKIYFFGDHLKMDSVAIKKGAFTITIPWKKELIPFVYSEYDAETTSGPTAFPIAPDGPGTIYMQVSDIRKGLISAKINGNNSAATFQAFTEGVREMEEQLMSAVDKRFPGKTKGDAAWNKAYRELRTQKLIPYIIGFVKTHSDSYAGAYILNRYLNALPSQDLEMLFNKLSPSLKNSEAAKAVQDHLSGLKRAAIGNQVEDFSLPAPNDSIITFSSLKGKYVLVDFWSSWCGPCKASFPHMKDVYKKYGGDQFEILGISIDEDKSAWLKELGKQQLPWPQVLDTKKIYVTNFAITGVPTGYLIGPDGKIIMKEIGFDKNGEGEIEKKLKALFDK